MPFKVKYELFDGQHEAAQFTTYDPKLAQVEFNDRINKGNGFWRMKTTVTPDNPTKPEAYVWHVYQVRELQRQYFNGGKYKEVLQKAIAMESELDKWNRQTQVFLHNHPNYSPSDTEAHAFFYLVFRWRVHWKDYFLYKKRSDADPAVVREHSKQCRDFEKQIDEYIKKQFAKSYEQQYTTT